MLKRFKSITAKEMTNADNHSVLNQHLKSFSENDLDGVLADYSSDAVLFIPADRSGVLRIKPFFKLLRICKAGASFSMGQQCVDGDYAYILWSAETADNSYEPLPTPSWSGRADRGAILCRQDHPEAQRPPPRLS